jgi:Ser/Thr protein kinase RdoA (MazF antagonist)
MSFELLTAESMLSAVEQATGLRMTGLTSPLPSYINRVYEFRAVDGTKLIAKFYRPRRWTRAAVEDEHRFIKDCSDAEIPVVAPMVLKNGTTLGELDECVFAVYPRRAGRQIEINTDSDWVRLGSLIARIHLAGSKIEAPDRITIDPRISAASDVEHLCAGILPERFREMYRSAAMHILDYGAPLFEATERIRIHGDCHRGNILDRLDEGLLIIDFDDMAMGPPIQDLWLILPDRQAQCRNELELLLQGYERFRKFDRTSLRCIETLRAMRMIYFLSWCSRQIGDFNFRKNFPDWGSDRFWQTEINDLREQLSYLEE